MRFSWAPSFFLNNYCVLDLETTGLNPRKSEILEVGILKIKDGVPVSKMEVLIRPKVLPVPFFITNLTGIRTEMVEDAPSIEEVASWIWDFIGDDPILAYNARFDLGFLEVHAPKSVPDHTYIDILKLARICFPELKSHKLSAMTAYLHLSTNTHRSLADCQAEYELYEICKRKLQPYNDMQIRAMICKDDARRRESWKAQKAAHEARKRQQDSEESD